MFSSIKVEINYIIDNIIILISVSAPTTKLSSGSVIEVQVIKNI